MLASYLCYRQHVKSLEKAACPWRWSDVMSNPEMAICPCTVIIILLVLAKYPLSDNTQSLLEHIPTTSDE